MRVLPALSGHVLRHGEILVMPSDRLLILDESGQINLVAPVNTLLNPADVTMKALARFLDASTQHSTFLAKKARHIEDYLQKTAGRAVAQ